jgi:thermitase
MDMIYPISYLISLAGLVTWFFVQGNRRLSKPVSIVFLMGFLVYLLALSLASADLSYKFLILFRDLVVLGVISQLFNIFQNSKVLSIGLGLAALLTIYFSYFGVLTYTFPQIDTDRMDPQGEFLVRLEMEPEMIDRLSSEWSCTFEIAFSPENEDITDLDDYYVVNDLNDSKRSRKKLYMRLDRAPGVEWVEANETLTLDDPEPTTPAPLKRDFFLNDPGMQQQWGLDPMGVDDLHRLLVESGIRPRKKANIAIVDSGVDAKHEDLRSNYTSYKAKYDEDPNKHGTHCAGIAAAVSNNKLGIASMSPGTGYVTVTGYKVINAYGMGTQKQVIKGIIEAVDAGADVISLSLGGPTQRRKEIAYKAAVDYALDHGAIVVVAAGNNNKSAKLISPANVEGVIVVSALNDEKSKAFFSNTVDDVKMGIAAPGQNIYSTIPDNKYASLSGTSMAAPYVSGLIGLMKSLRPELTAEEVYHILSTTGVKTNDGDRTGVLIQPYAAILELAD